MDLVLMEEKIRGHTYPVYTYLTKYDQQVWKLIKLEKMENKKEIIPKVK